MNSSCVYVHICSVTLGHWDTILVFINIMNQIFFFCSFFVIMQFFVFFFVVLVFMYIYIHVFFFFFFFCNFAVFCLFL